MSEAATSYGEIPLRAAPSWWQRLRGKGGIACAHVDDTSGVSLHPDQVRLRAGNDAAVRQPARRPITVCPECLLRLWEPELKFEGRRVIIAFEPARDGFSAFRFVEQQHLGDAELPAEDVIHCQSLVASPLGGCQKCAQPASVLLVKRGSTTESGKLTTFRGGKEYYCGEHGADRLVGLGRERLGKRRVEYFNFPYGERGLYIPGE